MFRDLLKKERQKLWLSSIWSATDTRTYPQALGSPEKANGESVDYERGSADLSEHRRSPGSNDVLTIARTASGL
jgi:hypothetical protein